MDSECSEETKKNINLAIRFLPVTDLEFNWENIKDETEREKLQELFQQLKEEDDPNARAETLDEVSERSIIN